MKYLFFLFLIISCQTKVKKEEVLLIPGKPTSYISSMSSWDHYSKDIDIMVAFLWPSSVREEQRPLLNEIIQTSRDLKNQKESFLKTSHELKKDFDQYFCNCVLNYECTGEEDIIDENICYEIEEKTYANERLLIGIYGLVELIKGNVKTIGGQWLDTHMDHRNLPSSQMNFSTMELTLSAFDSGSDAPYSYEKLNTNLIQDQDFKQLNVEFSRQHDGKSNYGSWRIEAAAIPSQYSLLFQGKLFWDHDGKSYEGMIYWEHPRTRW